ncbi:hypothetical protein BKA67DRAFT_564520 [Truncatella angustata]|uniref:Erythromycin esterase n=1 Tax=Truncatella angustata TaxID=152316 RepID=A0A9P8ZYP8_9PEZI|nr:uncharacterized protein BKA67DRAFT_564520 [Truncatella angustata]KAH6654246.1 hypothetical protein BKA67DRAFT_564520 [Truncatella angustata]
MSTPKRRSARIASASKTPNVFTRLGSVIEGDEEPAQQPFRSLDTIMSSPPKPSTPVSAAPVKLAMSEMHPSKVHQTMAPPSSGLRFGFVDINTDEKSRHQPSGITQTTPSKTRMPSSDFTFRVAGPMAGETETNLSPEARHMMDQIREQAAKHKAAVMARREKERIEEHAKLVEERERERKIAKAQSKVGRFDEAHMREFKKMDSITVPGTFTTPKPFNFSPLKSGMKRSQSKANLDEPEPSGRKPRTEKPLPSLPHATEEQGERDEPNTRAKRARQRIEDDASTLRPVSRDGGKIPRPKSIIGGVESARSKTTTANESSRPKSMFGLDSIRPQSSGNDSVRSGIPRAQTTANLMTPTKATVAKANIPKTPTITLVKSPSKPDLAPTNQSPSKSGLGGLVKSPTRSNLSSLLKSPTKPSTGGVLKKSITFASLGASQTNPSLVQTPGRFDRVRSILKGPFTASKPKSHLPQVAVAAPKTPGRTEKVISGVPMTTPPHKLAKRVEFTPDTKQAALSQNSPSPTKSAIPRSRTLPKLPAPEMRSIEAVMSAKTSREEIEYPDLSAYEEVAAQEKAEATGEVKEPSVLPEGVPGTFTFRSDHTIRFNSTSPSGFGGAAGQSSLRHVRPSMPGTFPSGIEPTSPNKENKDPAVMTGIPHGMSNKKRHRAVWEDEELQSGISHGITNKKRHRADADSEDDMEKDEGAERGAKKARKESTPAKGQALAAPKLAATPSPMKKKQKPRNGGTPSPQKKGISLSRLNMLARPKVRK